MTETRIPVVILGAGGFAAVVNEILSLLPDMLVIGCTDKALGLSDRGADEHTDLKILGDDDMLPELVEQHPGLRAVLALGPELMDVRARLLRTLERAHIEPLTVVHPRAIVSQTAKLGAGTIVRGGAVIGTGCHTGQHCVVNIGASIDHDARLGTNVFVGHGARIASHVELQDNVVVEIGASVNTRVVIGTGARIAGGAFVNTDIPDHAVVVGVPGRVVRYVET